MADLRPAQPLPTSKTNLRTLDPTEDRVIWLGHSSFFVQLDGQRILIDPVLSHFAAPVSFSTRAFEGTNLYDVADLPAIDLLLITHDHWDHLDHATVSALQGSVGQALVPLGVGAHLQHWGYTPQQIQELDWYDSQGVAPGFTVHLVPARHDSGRTLTRYQSLWGGYVLESSKKRLLFSGDTGYGPHFRQIAERFDRFDLVALDMGQYDPRWPYIHMTPQQAAQAVEELNAEALLPSHIGRFNLARHRWTAPLEQIVAASAGRPYQLVTPQIGEPLTLDHAPDAPEARYTHWWQAVPLTEPRLSAR